VDYFDSLGFFDCAKGRTEAHYDSIEELRRQLEEGKKCKTEDDLLENTHLSFSEIAAQTGFLSPAHFTTFVKRITGHTPSQIRQGGV